MAGVKFYNQLNLINDWPSINMNEITKQNSFFFLLSFLMWTHIYILVECQFFVCIEIALMLLSFVKWDKLSCFVYSLWEIWTLSKSVIERFHDTYIFICPAHKTNELNVLQIGLLLIKINSFGKKNLRKKKPERFPKTVHMIGKNACFSLN